LFFSQGKSNFQLVKSKSKNNRTFLFFALLLSVGRSNKTKKSFFFDRLTEYSFPTIALGIQSGKRFFVSEP